MTDAGFFRGTSSEQDNRFSDKEKKLLKQMKFADNLFTKIEMSKIRLDVLKPWISNRIMELLGMEDDVVAEFVVNQLEAEKNPDARKIQINLTGFLNGKNARIFMGELWAMLITAQESTNGIPPELVEAKKEEIRKRNEDQERLKETLNRTVSRFTEKLKQERESPPPGRRDRSNSRDRDSRRKPDFDDAKDSSGQSRRNYRSRKSTSPSPEPNQKKISRSRSNSRERRPDRDRRGARPSRDNSKDRGGDRDRRGGGPPDRRDYRDRPRRSRSPRPPQRRPRSRSPPYRGVGGRSRSPRPVRRRSPYNESRSNRNDSNYRDAPVRRDSSNDRDRFRSRHDDRRNGSPDISKDQRPPRPGRNAEEGNALNNKAKRDSPEPTKEKDSGKSSASSDDSSSPENGSSKPTSKRKSSSADSEKSGDEEDPNRPKKDKKDKKKKKEKRHKKHKKQKKLKKSKDKTSDDESAAVEKELETAENEVVLPSERIAQSFLKLVQPEDPLSEDLESKLREKALESMKKANMNR